MNISVSKGYYPFDITKIEQKYNAKYIGDFCTKKPQGGWNERPVAIFYVENPDTSKGHTHYFGLYVDYDVVDGKRIFKDLYITCGDSAFEDGLIGAIANDGEIVVSCYKHHWHKSKDGSVVIDGGRDYVKLQGSDVKTVKLKIEKDQIVINETEENIQA